MRLLAYGGTSYRERRRVGIWPSIPEGALGDTYGLSEDELSFGVGLVEDHQPFLVLRQRQVPDKQSHRQYAYTLLLDPGADLWQHYGWNGASLIVSLLSEPFREVVLARPEDLDEQQLINFLKEHKFAIRASATKDDDELLSLWTGSLLTSNTVIAPRELFGARAILTPDSVSLQLSHLAACFRCGRGWLIGGSEQNAQALGAGLVIDMYSDAMNEEARIAVERGRKVLCAWSTVASDDEFKTAIEKPSNTPVWAWQAEFGYSPAQILPRVVLLAEALNPASSVDSLIESLPEKLPEPGPLDREIHAAARRLALSKEGALSPTCTAFFLNEALNHGAVIDATVANRLDDDTVITELLNRQIQPDAVAGIRFAPGVRLASWLGLIKQASNSSAIPRLVCRAIQDLQSDDARPVVSERELLDLVDYAAEETAARDKVLSVWIPYRDHPVIGLMVQEVLFAKSLSRLQKRAAGWPLDYLAFGQDPTLVKLAKLGLDRAGLEKLIYTTLEETEKSGPLCHEARSWLINLGVSPLRASASLATKIRICNSTTEGWNDFRELQWLYRGGREMRTQTGAKDKELLLAEFGEMMQHFPPQTFVPNLRGLTRFLGSLPERCAEKLARLTPPISSDTVEQWIAGWRLLGREDLARREKLRLLLETPEDLGPSLLESKEVPELLELLLFKRTAADDATFQSKIRQILTRALKSAELRACIERAIKAGAADEQQWRVFLRRIAWRPELMNDLFECLSGVYQDHLISALAEDDPERFRAEAYDLYRSALESPATVAAYARAVFRFLLSPQGEDVRSEVAIDSHGIHGAGKAEARLLEFLGNSAGSSKDTEEDEGAAKRDNVAATTRSAWIKEKLRELVRLTFIRRTNTHRISKRRGSRTIRRGR